VSDPTDPTRPAVDLARWLDGAWARSGRRIGGGALVEPSSVLWVTVAPYFCDLRVLDRDDPEPHLLDRTQAFAGTLSVDGDIVTWSHDLDTESPDPRQTDTATVTGGPTELIETGAGYEERWTKVSAATESAGGVPRGVADRSTPDGTLGARMVLSGELAIAVWAMPSPGGALIEGGQGWATTRSVGHQPAGLELPAVAAMLSGEASSGPPAWRRVG
jgi:hypothetical protein